MKKHNIIITTTLIGLTTLGINAQAEEGKTDKWKCKFCPYEDLAGWKTDFGLGLGYNTNDSYKYGDFTGLTEEGLYFIGNLDVRYSSEETPTYVDIHGENIGLESAAINMEVGRQGQYRIKLSLDQIPKYLYDTSRTPYRGGNNQSLPAGWVQGANTSNFTTLATDLRDQNIDTERSHLDVDLGYNVNEKIKLGAAFQRRDKQGRKAIAASFGFSGNVILAQPIDYTTDNITLYGDMKGNKWLARLSYKISNFKNSNRFLAWDNAYTAPTSDGQMATEPDNQMQQFGLSGRYDASDKLFVLGSLAIGSMTQDETFLPYTVNAGLAPAALPKTSLDGKINTFHLNVLGQYRASDKLNLSARFLQDEQDNDTARATYDYVATDSAISPNPRANFPFSFRKQELSAKANYKLNKKSKLLGGVKLRKDNRTYQEVSDSNTNSLWVQYSNKLSNKMDLRAKVNLEQRSVDSYGTISELTDPENPLLRKYNLADRDRNQIALRLNSYPSDKLNLAIDVQYNADDYGDSQVGLTEGTESTISFDGAYQVSEDLGLHSYLVLSTIESSQAGSQAFATPDWFADNEDKINTLGIGANYQVIEDKLRVELDYTYSDSTGSVTMQGLTDFPDLTVTRHTLRLMGHYQIKEKLKLVVGYLHEDYKEENWAVDGVAPDTVGNVLGLGVKSPEYTVGTFLTSIYYSIK